MSLGTQRAAECAMGGVGEAYPRTDSWGLGVAASGPQAGAGLAPQGLS
jgi:hypothetical protein